MIMIVREEDGKVMSWMDELQEGVAVPEGCYVTDYDSTMDEFNEQAIGEVYIADSISSTGEGIEVNVSPPKPKNPVAELMKAKGKQNSDLLTWDDMIEVTKELGMEL